VRPAAAALWLLAAVLWFGTLGIRPLYKADESRYGEISREMLASGDWVTPRLNGFKYFEKPPLQYWATATFFSIFGEKDWVARLWTALLGFAGIALVLCAGNRLFGAPTGAYAAAVLAGCPLYVLLGEVTTLDMGVSFFLTVAVLAFALGNVLVFWAACALAVLSKGLIGIVLPLGAVGLYIVLKRDWALIARLRLPTGLAIFFALSAPWFIAAAVANPEFLHFFFIQEHFQRFTTELHQRVHPFWYFVPILAAGMVTWLLPLLVAVWRTAVSRSFDAGFFLLLWALVVFAFFSASHSKLPPYILPMLPALALLVARQLTARLLVVQSGLVVLGAIAVAIAVPYVGVGYAAYGRWLLVAAMAMTVAGVAGHVLAHRQKTLAAAAALACGSLIAMQIGIAGHGATLAPRFSAEPTIAALPDPVPADAPVFAVDTYDHTIPWGLRRTVTLVRYRDELGVAVDWEPQKFIPDLDGFARAWRAAPQAWAFLAVRDASRLRAELGLPMQEVAHGPTYVVVRKP